jgi:hypothetical protein
MMLDEILICAAVSDDELEWNEVEFGTLIGLAFGAAIAVVAGSLMLWS